MSKYDNLIGRKFGMLTVIDRSENDKHGTTRWVCNCDCGNENIVVNRALLMKSKNPNCGCVRKDYQNIAGLKSGRLTAIKYIGQNKRGANLWQCNCECGGTSVVVASDLRAGTIRSCGCLKKEMTSLTKTKHHQSGTPLYSVWLGIKDRCLNPKSKQYFNYGGRGITVCDEWLGEYGSTNFCKWSLDNGYKKGLELDRIDVNKGYSPDNCRWVSNSVQANNKRTTRFITYNGKTQSLADWCREYKLPYVTIQGRLSNNWDFERAITTPIKRTSKNRKHIRSDEVITLLLQAKAISTRAYERTIITQAIKEIENL